MRHPLCVLPLAAALACGADGSSSAGDGGDAARRIDGPRPDRPPALGCDPTDPSACGVGRTCTVVNEMCDLACVPAGRLGEGAACSAGGEPCGVGLRCLLDALTGRARCFRQCGGDADCGEGRCSLGAVGCPETSPPIRFCGPAATPCLLLAPDCPPGEGCYVVSLSPTATGCLPAGTVPVGGACGTAHTGHCVAGALCVGTAGPPPSYRCARLCAPGGGAPGCTEPEACEPLPDVPSVGVCVVPRG